MRSHLKLSIVAIVPLVCLPLREARAEDGSGSGMRSPGAFGIGLFLSGVGSAGLAAGGYLFSHGQGSCDSISRDQVPSQSEIDACVGGVTQQVAGVVTMVTGGAFLIAGLPVMISGAVPADKPATPSVAVQVGAGNASLKLSF